jgi:hypothetical protein
MGKNKWVVEVRLKTFSLGVNSDQTKLIPNFIEQNIDSQLHLARNASVLLVTCKQVNVLNRNSVNLVVDIDALCIFSVALNHINEVINIIVSVEFYVRIVDSILL